MNWLFRYLLVLFFLQLLLVLLMILVGQHGSDGGIVAYTLIDDDHDPHVMMIDAWSGITLELTPLNYEGRAPRWTPDGKRVAFSAVLNRDERHILEVTLEHYQTRNLTQLWGYESVPVYSPIDNRIGFPLNPNTSNMPLFVVDDANPDAEAEVLLPRIRRNVAWSPDGQYLAYIMIPEQEDTQLDSGNANVLQPDLFTTNLITGETINWTEDLPNITFPAWSPDSTRIAITTTIATSGNLQIINVQTGEITALLTPSAGVQSTTWSPDGRFLAFTARENGDFEIFVMDVATGESRNLSQSPSFDVSPTWSADGEHIAYVSHRNGQNDIYIVHVASGRTRRLTYTPDDEGEVTWRPNHQ